MIEQPTELWKQALFELQQQTTRATFDTWLRNTHCNGVEGNVLIVLVKDAYAVDWLKHRLIKPIMRMLRRLTESEDIDVRFVVSEIWPPQALDPSTALRMTSEMSGPSASSGGDVRRTPEAGGPSPPSVSDDVRMTASPAEIDELTALYVALNYVDDPTARLAIQQQLAALEGNGNGHGVWEDWNPPCELDKNKNFSMVSHYENYFMGPYLGAKAFHCWMVIYSRDKRPKKTLWTPRFRFSAPQLARKVGCCTQTIHGVRRRCEADDPGAILYTPHDMFGSVEEVGEPEYYQYRPGLIERLRQAGVARYEIEGTRSRKLYVVSVKTNLGWLTPAQLSTLKPEVQMEHDCFVMEMGVDPAHWHS